MKLSLIAVLSVFVVGVVQAEDHPNILWIFAEDTSPWMGCYGDPVNTGATPNIDMLAKRGVRFSRAFVPAPVCSPCRSAMMGGQNQIRFGAHEHRSSRGPRKIQLPQGMKLLPRIMKDSGFYTFNLGKEDYNFEWDLGATYSLKNRSRSPIPWGKIKGNQPFFGQIQTAGGKQNTTKFPANRKVDPSTVTVPPDYPQNQLYREVVAEHYDSIRKDDDFVGEILRGLKESGLLENTIVVYFSDHGANNLVRHKQMPTEGGLHVPFIVTGPQRYVPEPEVRDDLVNMLDLSATTLAWAGIDQPTWYEGHDLFAEGFKARQAVFSAKDRLDHTLDRVRTVRTDRYRYTRNYKTDRVLLQPQYRDSRPFVVNLRELYASGNLSPKLTEIYFGERPAEELYDVRSDPHQLNNLIKDRALQEEVQRHRVLLDHWLSAGDFGEGEEPLEELSYQAKDQKWGKAVNPEYEVVRSDRDGDGLSDAWERINGRDPEDGRLQFLFDCGGWQTEGWSAAEGQLGNIAGRQGYLDFNLRHGRGVIERDGLNLNSAKNQGDLVMSVRSSKKVDIRCLSRQSQQLFMVVGEHAGVGAGSEFVAVRFPIVDADYWSGSISALRFEFNAAPDTLIEIDSIEIQ